MIEGSGSVPCTNRSGSATLEAAKVMMPHGFSNLMIMECSIYREIKLVGYRCIKPRLILLGKATQSYDISDFQDVDITVGGLTAFTSLMTAAKARDLKVSPPPPLQGLLSVHLISKRALLRLESDWLSCKDGYPGTVG
jgi:hypothetical protein